MSRRRQSGAPAPEVDLRRGWILTQIGAADRGGQLDLKIVRGLLRGLSARGPQSTGETGETRAYAAKKYAGPVKNFSR